MTNAMESESGIVYDYEKTLQCGWAFKLYDPKSYQDMEVERAALLNNAVEEFIDEEQSKGRDITEITDGEVYDEAINRASEEMARNAKEDEIQYHGANSSVGNNRKTIQGYVGSHMRLVSTKKEYMGQLMTEDECEKRVAQAREEGWKEGWKEGMADSQQ